MEKASKARRNEINIPGGLRVIYAGIDGIYSGLGVLLFAKPIISPTNEIAKEVRFIFAFPSFQIMLWYLRS